MLCNFCACFCLLALAGCFAQLSDPHFSDEQKDLQGNKYLQRQATEDGDVPPLTDEVVRPDEQCEANIAVKWLTELTSSIYATPIISDLYSDGHKEVIVPSFVHYLEAVEAADGAKVLEDGWPAFHESTVHASPLLYDFDADGIQDVLLATYDGEILVFKDNGEKLREKLVIPRLRVRKRWYEGLNEDPIDHSHPDAGHMADAQYGFVGQGQENSSVSDLIWRRRHLLQVTNGQSDVVSTGNPIPGNLSQAQQELNQAGAAFGGADPSSRLFGDPLHEGHMGSDPFGKGHMAWDDLPLDADPHMGSRYGYDDDYMEARRRFGHHWDFDEGWGGGWESHFDAPGENEGEFVWLDAHVLCTPAIADIDRDGHQELVVAATYYFDRDKYDTPEKLATLGNNIDLGQYVGGGIVAFDLHSRMLKWQKHLDLSTDRTAFRAHIYSSPTLVDLEADGALEVLVGTSMGYVYVLDSKGDAKPGWPLQMGEVQAQVAVADVDADGQLEVVAGDARGTLAVFTAQGTELWERHIASGITQEPMFGDIDADGMLEVVFATSSGAVYAVNGRSGRDIANFPFRTRGRVMAPVLVTKAMPATTALQVVVPSADGHLYIIDGKRDVVDIGETAYARVLADDLDNDGHMDLLLATMGGNLYCLSTGAAYDPLATWTSQVHEGNNFVARSGWLGVAATPDARAPRDVRGQQLTVRFEITDRRPVSQAAHTPSSSSASVYTVAVKLEGVGASDMRGSTDPVDSHPPIIGSLNSFAVPGTYSTPIPCPRTRSSATVRVEMTDSHGITVSDSFALSFHMHFHRLLKWLVAVPLLSCTLAVLVRQKQTGGPMLPSFRRSSDH